MGLAADGVPQPQTITPTDFARVPNASRLGTCARSGILPQSHSDGHRAHRSQEAVALDRQLTVCTVAAALRETAAVTSARTSTLSELSPSVLECPPGPQSRIWRHAGRDRSARRALHSSSREYAEAPFRGRCCPAPAVKAPCASTAIVAAFVGERHSAGMDAGLLLVPKLRNDARTSVDASSRRVSGSQ
jgi:hypothetical protein